MFGGRVDSGLPRVGRITNPRVRYNSENHRKMKPVKAPLIDPQYSCFDIVIRPSKIHRYGVYANQRIPANRKVIEYTGMRLNRKEAAAIEGGKYTYLFAVDDYWTLDGARGGSGAEGLGLVRRTGRWRGTARRPVRPAQGRARWPRARR